MRYYDKKSHAVHALHAHIVLTPRYRRAVFADPAVRTLAINSIAAICSELCIALEAIEVDKDHLHLLIRYRPALSLSAIIARIKGGSSRAIRLQSIPAVQQMLWGDHFWSPSYCAISCGGAPIETIKQYIENQGK
jgi:putative transposase